MANEVLGVALSRVAGQVGGSEVSGLGRARVVSSAVLGGRECTVEGEGVHCWGRGCTVEGGRDCSLDLYPSALLVYVENLQLLLECELWVAL